VEARGESRAALLREWDACPNVRCEFHKGNDANEVTKIIVGNMLAARHPEKAAEPRHSDQGNLTVRPPALGFSKSGSLQRDRLRAMSLFVCFIVSASMLN
jgi:hypothetical protein